MKIHAKSQIWLSNPTQALKLDMENGQVFADQITLCHYRADGSPPYDMTSLGWVHIGEVELTYTITKRPEEIALASVQALQAKLAEKAAEHERLRKGPLEALAERDAEHEKLRNDLLEAISKFQALTYEAPKTRP